MQAYLQVSFVSPVPELAAAPSECCIGSSGKSYCSEKGAYISGGSLTWTGGIKSKLLVVSTILSAYVRRAVQSTASAFCSPLITTLYTTYSQYRNPVNAPHVST